ncbi:MAG: peptide ABC transporter permease [Candidatus Muproteobacteria bacterium RBG_16_65_31]|jgi:spermidine/putrescine transport system permease protein|uniref:Peptide ABC transporter permease n=1 Tax=Candidatus Muproteobacteria bacterium RBG_16_65_31 TaxID=1817759 RepID=A0A1F6TGG2_9PROT|nr:MAG: peptide ABC transporter permease [Candidatus Muproteobacteria bacterium RBG_16_65_31]
MRALRRRLGLISLLFPTYAWLAFAIFAPLMMMLVFSFLSDVPIGGRSVHWTADNYTKFLSKAFYFKLSVKSIRMGLLTTAFCVIVGYPMAYAIAKVIRGRWKSAMFLLVILPFWSSSLIRAYSWIIVLRQEGVINSLVLAFHLPSGSVSILFTFAAVIIGLVHAYLPYVVLTIYVSLDRIDDTLIQAAQSLGANRLQSFLRVTLPLSLPGVLAGAILTFIPSTGSFMEPRVLGGTSGTVIGTIIEDQFVSVFNWTFGAALAFILLVVVGIILAASAQALRRAQVFSIGGR